MLPIDVVEAQGLPTRPTSTGCLPVDENVAWALSSDRRVDWTAARFSRDKCSVISDSR